jgi:predicted aldo/keto reductase-like oxidoreductase
MIMKGHNSIDRRKFLKASAAGLVGAGASFSAGKALAGQEAAPAPAKIKAHRILGRTGFKASDIGIGTSQTFPTPVLSAALDAGVNYIDTAEGYGRGAAERSIGEAIKGRDRKSLFLTTKVRYNADATKEQIVERAGQCLERLETPYVDCLMLQAPPTAEAVKNEAFHQAVDSLKKDGKVRFAGVANHGSRFANQGESMEDVLVAAVEDGRFDVVLVVYNFLQREAGAKVLEAAAKKNVAATIMKSNPLGRYYDMKDRFERMKAEGQAIDERMQKSMAQMEETAKQAQSFIEQHGLKTPAEIKTAALKFVLGDPRVHTLNLAFNTFDDVQNYVSLSGSGLAAGEKGLLAAYEKECGSLYCRHACGLCEPSCPHGVPVNTIMRYNHYFEAQGSERYAMEKYAALDADHADACGTCPGPCEQACPYGVPVRSLLALAHRQLCLG